MPIVQNATLHLSICTWHFEELLAFFAEKRPERVAPERGAIRQQHQIHRAQRQREDPRPGTPVAERHADGDVRRAPDNRDQCQGGESSGDDAGGELSPAVRGARRDERECADPQRERRQADERGQQTPEDEQNADEVNMRIRDRYSITRFVIAT